MFHRTLFTMNNRGYKVAALLLLAAVGLGLAAWQLSAQESALPGYRTYALRNANATDLAVQVRGVLAGVRGKSDVVIDKQSNSLLVSGSDEAHRVVAQLVGALDLPAQPITGKGKGEPVVKAYRLPEAGERLVADLRKRYPASSGTSLSVDSRTRQLLVMAPEEVHRQLAKELVGEGQVEKASAQQPAKLNGPRDAAALAAPPEVTQRAYALKNINWQSFEDFLQRIWGNKAALETNRSGEVAAIRLKNAAGEEAIARVDRRHNEVSFEGTRGAAGNWAKLVSVLDSGPTPREQALQLVPVHRADPDQLQDAIELIKAAMRDSGPHNPGDAARALQVGDRALRQPGGELVAKIFQPIAQPPAAQPPAAQPGAVQPGAAQPGAAQPMAEGEIPLGEGAIGPVQIEFLEGLDVIVIRGKKEDVERVTAIIRQIEAQSATTTPVIELYYLRNTSSAAVGDLVIQLYNSVLAARGGRVSITPLGKPNALLMIGSRDSITAVLELVKKLDVPVNPNSLFKVFQLNYMSATNAKVLLDDFFLDRGPLGTVIKVSVDARTNAVVVYGGERDIAEAERLLTNLDRDETGLSQEIRTFKLNNALASDLAPLLQQSLTGNTTSGANQPGGQQQTTTTGSAAAATKLIMRTVDAKGNQILSSGNLEGVLITADTNANALLVRSPAKSMDLIAALIAELDRLPESEAQIKVFTIVNGDATALGTMLQQLFGQQGGGGNQDGFNQPITASGENTLVPLSFAVDARTNSIVASGAAGDLNVVEAILLRLDEGDVRQRKTTVYRLKNAPAIDVANAINQFLTNERAVQQLNQAQSPFEQLEREVVVVPEAVSNSLIVSATPRFYDEVAKVVEELDARPPMVMIQVLIAEVSLSDTEEFGAEFGLQDSILFDRSTSVAGVGVPGFNFNNNPLGNSDSARSLATRNDLGTQSLTSFSVGRTNGPLGYGGLVLSASNDSVSILIRALQDSQRMQVLSRPQVMTLDNQSAFVQVGQRVPRITSTTNSQNGITNATVLENVGLLLGVTPRISPDGLVVMEIDAEKSQLGPVDTGIPISINQNGDVIRSPIINTTLAQTTVSARSGQTVILSGLITKNRNISSRRIPYLSDIPVLGRLFRFDSSTDSRSELLIIMTPHIVRNEADADWLKQVESDRMSWCLADVVEIHGAASGLSGGHGLWGPALPPVIFPDLDPTGSGHGGAMEAPLPLSEEGTAPRDPSMVPTPPQPRDPFLNPPMPQPTVPPQVTPPSPAVSPFFPPRTGNAKDKNNGASSRRGAAPTPAMPIKQAAYSPYPQGTGEVGLRTEKSDTATVFYAEPPSTTPRRMPPTSQPVYGPAPRGEAAPAYYQQPTPAPLGASKYPTQQAYAPAR